MSSKSLSKPSKQNALAQIKQNIPIQLTDLSIFDNSYAFMRDRFAQEMKRIDQQMLKFRKAQELSAECMSINNRNTKFAHRYPEYTGRTALLLEGGRLVGVTAAWLTYNGPILGLSAETKPHKRRSDLTLCFGETSGTGYGSLQNNHASNWEVLQNSPLVIGEGEEKALKLQFDVSAFAPSEIKVKLLNDTLIITATHEEKTKDTAVYREYNRQFKLPPGTDPDSLVSSLSRDGVLTIQAPLMLPASKE